MTMKLTHHQAYTLASHALSDENTIHTQRRGAVMTPKAEHTRKTAYAEARSIWPHPSIIEVWIAPRAKYAGRCRFSVVRPFVPGVSEGSSTIRDAADSWDALVSKMRERAEEKPNLRQTMDGGLPNG